MPLPKPNDDEDKDGFVGRCMGDGKMLEEYPDDSQRSAVCHNLFSKETRPLTEALHSMLFKGKEREYTWQAEVFAVGRWNGMSFTRDDLEDIVNNFNTLKAEGFRVPLKLGHNDDQPVYDGQPAMGWVTGLSIGKGKYNDNVLLATFDKVPEVIHKTVEAGRYSSVSIELDFDVTYKGKRFKNVLSGVALLGADLPAVHTLAELQHYLGRDVKSAGSLAGKHHRAFNVMRSDGTFNKEDFDMDKDKEIEELKAKAAAAEAEAKAEREKREKFERDEQARLERERVEKIKFNRDTITKHLEDAVAAMELTPAQRDSFTKMLGVGDDDKMSSLDVAEAKSLIDANKAKPGGSVQGFSRDGNTGGATEADDAGDMLDRKARKFQLDHNVTYSVALERVMLAEPELAKQHILAPGVVGE